MKELKIKINGMVCGGCENRVKIALSEISGVESVDAEEDIVLRRLRIIDMAKGIINSIAIDANGEDYDYKTVTFSGVKDIIYEKE